jgi:RND family efflux transporter MFP subunit
MRKKPARKKPQALSLRVQTLSIQRQDRWLYLEGFGTTQADQRVEIVPEVNGKVVYSLDDLKPGLLVKRRSLLFRIDAEMYQFEYERLKRQYDSLKVQVKLSEDALKLDERDQKRNERLLKRQAIDPGTFDRVRLRVIERIRALESLRQNLAITEVQKKQAALNLSRTKLFAPFDGRVTQGNLSRGSFVASGRGVATLESTEAVDLPVAFSLDDLQKIRTEGGDSVSLDQIPAFLQKHGAVAVGRPNEAKARWQGVVQRVGGRLDLTTRTLDLWIHIPLRRSTQRKAGALENKELLLPGVFCKARIPVRKIPRAVRIPRQAIYDNKYVYLVADGRLKRREIRIVHTGSEDVIVQEGFQDNEKLVTSPLTDPIEGTPVFVTPNGSSARPTT